MLTVFKFSLFFSSRRRHTRCLSDWSSDVCSSDPSRRRHKRCLSDWSSDVCSSDLVGGSYQHNYDQHSRTDNGQGINNQIVYQVTSSNINFGNFTYPTGMPASQ